MLCYYWPLGGQGYDTNSLDQDFQDVITPRERLLKRKFPDSFALICAIKRDGDTVSAACLEEGAPEGIIVRIASNSEVSETSLSQLQTLRNVLNNIARGGEFLSNVLYIDCI